MNGCTWFHWIVIKLARRGDKQHDKMRCIFATMNWAKLWTSRKKELILLEEQKSFRAWSMIIFFFLFSYSPLPWHHVSWERRWERKKKEKKYTIYTYRKAIVNFFFYSTHLSASFLWNNNFFERFSNHRFISRTLFHELDYIYIFETMTSILFLHSNHTVLKGGGGLFYNFPNFFLSKLYRSTYFCGEHISLVLKAAAPRSAFRFSFGSLQSDVPYP